MPTGRQVLELLKVDYIERPNRLSFCCPFHDDTDPSTGFYMDTELCFCYACDHTLDPIGFYAKFQGLAYWRAKEDLEKLYGETPDKEAAFDPKTIAVARNRMEKRLKEERPNLPLKVYAHLGEWIDRLLLMHERGKRPPAGLDNDSQVWFTCLEECRNGNFRTDPDGTPRASLDDWFQEGVANLFGTDGSAGEVDLD